jgi:hypothetical protein
LRVKKTARRGDCAEPLKERRFRLNDLPIQHGKNLQDPTNAKEKPGTGFRASPRLLKQSLAAATYFLGHAVVVNDDRFAHPVSVTDADRHVTAHMPHAHIVTIVVNTDCSSANADADPHVIRKGGDGHGDPNGCDDSKSKCTH